MFYNELDMLTYRLNLLNNIVDYFVLVEAIYTFIGKKKKLYYNDNKHLFDKFNNKIIHIIVNDLPYIYPNVNINNNDQWHNENFHRNAISQGINNITDISNDDLIIIADLDEIPDPRTLQLIKDKKFIVDINILQMEMYYYNLNTKYLNDWYHCKILSYKKYK
jgi:beta-1,4-mannosyl-glycoprotein beta-1,4-N-acetylglucosaminyltransferase